MSDLASSTPPRSGARAYSRLDYEQSWRPRTPANTPHAPEAPTTVTLDKIGDFLELDFGRAFVWIREGLKLAAVLAAAGAIAGGAYALLSPPRYTVTTDIMIDPGNLQVVEGDLFSQPGAVDGQLLNAGSKLRVLTSRNVLARVVTDLDLTSDPEFYDPAPAGFSLSSLFGGASEADSARDAAIAAVTALGQHVSTRADEKSFVASLLVSSEKTDKAIAISDAIVKAFRDELAAADADSAARAAEALDGRLDELKTSVLTAEERVQAFRRQHNLSSSGDGQLLSTQAMSALNAQVVEAQTRLITARTNYETLVAAGPQANPADASATGLAALRERAGALDQQLLAQSMIYGPRHPTIVGLSAERDAVRAQLGTEIQRVVAAAKTALEEAQTNLDALTARADSLTSSVFSDNELQVQLRELERDAAAKSAVYENFLSRARQIAEREQIDTTVVRVISTAVPPPGRSWPPRTVLMIGLGGVAGLLLGLVIAIGIGIRRDMRAAPEHRPA